MLEGVGCNIVMKTLEGDTFLKDFKIKLDPKCVDIQVYTMAFQFRKVDENQCKAILILSMDPKVS